MRQVFLICCYHNCFSETTHVGIIIAKICTVFEKKRHHNEKTSVNWHGENVALGEKK